MIRDENVFIMGEEVGRYNGAYKVSLAIGSGSGSGGEPGASYVRAMWELCGRLTCPSPTYLQGSACRLHNYRCCALESGR
jgi:hypothetical protein